ncbi:hypothetical protein CSC70_03820 [Pseudoxanthomonas kalamensis DSM 18571]|uniref:DnaT-like ssDNA-binding protein n=1 Tax=Pseudoxanthomonas kalamensis TaxID=289483 RepID=UPI001391FA99|nr:DnaT-like ssDNA-binding protein [Pseudoxanthomonas kalamensis]KAF1711065.1 hypothetical protein CSC70_03820 [Pseudoxanthomonas kalamensis DSM 18571]
MALTIEDGTGVTGADSYATAAELADRAAAYGWTIPATESEQEVLLRRAAEAMNGLDWKGSRKGGASQSMAWPRTGVAVDGEILADDYIPAPILYGQMALAAEIHADDIDPPEARKGAVTKEKVDVLEVEYATVENSGKLMRAAPDRPSQVQFADYLARRGLYALSVTRA